MTPESRISQAGRNRRLIALTFVALRDHKLTPAELLESPPSCLKRIRVYDVLRRFPHMGRDGADKLLRKTKIWPTTPLGKLTDEERRTLIAHLPPRVTNS